MEWRYVKPLKSVELIDEFEKMVGFEFVQSFRECVMANNGGRPSKQIFDTNKTRGRDLKSFLSFNREDIENVWDDYEWNGEKFEEIGKIYIPFATSNFGDPIAFDIKTGHVIFVDHETLEIEQIAETFEEFLNKLYEDED